MDLALVTGRGPTILTRFDGANGPLVRDEDVVAVGARDAEEREHAGSQDVRATRIHLFRARRRPRAWNEHRRGRGDGYPPAARALRVLASPRRGLLDDAVKPAVDYRLPGGLSPEDLYLRSACMRTQWGSLTRRERRDLQSGAGPLR